MAPSETIKPPNLVRGLAPREMPCALRFLYVALRLIHLLAVSAVLPLALVYLGTGPGGRLHVPVYLGWIVAIACMIWALIFVVLEQYGYPTALPGATLATVTMVLNGWSGMRIADFSLFYGAYQVLISALFAQFVFLAGIAVVSAYYLARRESDKWGVSGFYFYFLLGLVAALGLMLFFAQRPLLAQFRQEKSFLSIGMVIIPFLAHAAAIARNMWDGSAFKKHEKLDSLREELHNRWAALAALALVLCITISLFVALL